MEVPPTPGAAIILGTADTGLGAAALLIVRSLDILGYGVSFALIGPGS